MGNKSELDLATDILKERIGLASQEIRNRAKGTDPYRQEPISSKEAIYNFSQLSPEMIQQARQTMGDDVVNHYLANIQKMMARRQGNA